MHLEIKGKKYPLPDSWSQVTVRQHLQIQNIAKDETLDSDEKETSIIKVLANIPNEIYNQCSQRQLKAALQSLTFITTEIPLVDLKQPVTINKVEYYFDLNLDAASHGMFTDLKNLLNEDIDNNLCKLLAILFRPAKKKNYNYKIWKGFNKANYVDSIQLKEYNAGLNVERAELFQDMPIDSAHSAAVFFLIFIKEYLNLSIRNYMSEATEPETQED